MKNAVLITILLFMGCAGNLAPAPALDYGPQVKSLEAQVDSLWYYTDMQGFLLEALYGEIELVKIELKELRMPDGSVYQVKPGDNLWGIAERELGIPERWAEIWLLNIWTIREADVIFPGQLLKVKP